MESSLGRGPSITEVIIHWDFPNKIFDLFIIPLLDYLYFLKLYGKWSENIISANGLTHVKGI